MRGASTHNWWRGYFCAVAILLRETGHASTSVVSLFKQGGDPKFADPDDLELFRENGLIGSSEVERGLAKKGKQ